MTNEAEMKEPEREDLFLAAINESADAQAEAASALRDVASRLERLSEEMRKVGAFPIAGQIERDNRNRAKQNGTNNHGH